MTVLFQLNMRYYEMNVKDDDDMQSCNIRCSQMHKCDHIVNSKEKKKDKYI